MPRRRVSQNSIPSLGRPPVSLDLLLVHRALEGWIHRQHVITRKVVAKETTKLRAEIAALRKELRRRR